MEFTPEQTQAIDKFHFAVQELILGCEYGDNASFIIDDIAFYGPLCDMIAEYCANHGVAVHYPTRYMSLEKNGVEEIVQETMDATDQEELAHWNVKIQKAKKEENHNA